MHGLDFSQEDGADGETIGTPGGFGANAGVDGEAYAAGQASGIVALNTDDQPSLQWSFNHSQSGTIELAGGGGGGGGGGGEGFENFIAPSGGNGGAGRDAVGVTITTQDSNVDVTAELIPAVWVDINNDVTDAWITVDLGWTSTSSPTLGNFNATIPIWRRRALAQATITPVGGQDGNGQAQVTILDNGEGNQLSATGFDGYGNFFDIFSTATEDAAVGTLGCGPSETAVRTLPGAVATIDGGEDFAFRSVLTGNMTAFGGGGGEGGGGGGNGGGNFGTPGVDGGVDPSGTEGGGAEGGGGGAGSGGSYSGGNGGQGGDGGGASGYAAGFYQGTISITVSQL